jgi:4-amino-4-deoxy-L-arabinose transferase-like glycosyltransferase
MPPLSVFVVADVFLILLCLFLLVLAVRAGIRHMHTVQQAERERLEADRESVALSQHIQRSIWEAQEWELDTTELKQAKAQLDFERLAVRAEHHSSVNYQFPLAVGLTALMAGFFVSLAPDWFFWGTVLGEGAFLLCLVWAGIHFRRYRRIMRLIAARRKE